MINCTAHLVPSEYLKIIACKNKKGKKYIDRNNRDIQHELPQEVNGKMI